MTNELAIRNGTRLTGLAAFAQDNDMVMLAGDPLYFKKGVWYRGQEAFDPKGLHFIVNYRRPTPAGPAGAKRSRSSIG
jgi:hypothetical protein